MGAISATSEGYTPGKVIEEVLRSVETPLDPERASRENGTTLETLVNEKAASKDLLMRETPETWIVRVRT